MTTYNRDGSVDHDEGIPTYQQYTTLPFLDSSERRRMLDRIPPETIIEYEERLMMESRSARMESTFLLAEDMQERRRKDRRKHVYVNMTLARLILRVLDLALYGAIAWLVLTCLVFVLERMQ